VVTQEPVGIVSESPNIQLADGGDNGVLAELEIPGGNRDKLVMQYVDQLVSDGWSEVAVSCRHDTSSEPTTVVYGRKWTGYETAAIVSIVDNASFVDVRVVLRAPFHNSDGQRPNEDTPPDLDCFAP
ncbi:MAG: hypothetical protein MI921_26005, partial [Cytophagales bacterium]|nr:hypothetical protein [Cytophagales bacterium]